MLRATFLPYANFRQSVNSYSDATLHKTLRLMLSCQNCLNRDQYSIDWREKNIWILWREWKQAFIRLAMMCVDNAVLRDVPFNGEDAKRLFRAKNGKHWQKPLWIGWEPLHSSHRAALMQLGEVERLSLRVIKWKHLEQKPKPEQWASVANWFERFGFSNLTDGNSSYNQEVDNFLDTKGAPPLGDHHYNQFNWTEQPEGNVTVWPVEPGESWLCKI